MSEAPEEGAQQRERVRGLSRRLPVRLASVATGCRSNRGEDNMATYLAFHEVDDVEHWLKSGKREEFFGPHGITARTFRDPNGSNRVGMIVEIPDFAVFEQLMQTEGLRKR
jgi:hypothetical protein